MKNTKNVPFYVQDAVEIEIGSQLMSKLMASETQSIPYGVIRGKARPIKSSDVIKSPHVADVTGLIQRVRTREHKSEWSRTTRLWYVHNCMKIITILL